MSRDISYVNPRTGGRWPISQPRWCAPDDHGVLELEEGPGIRRHQINSGEHSLWRYAAALRGVRRTVSLNEGWSPLLQVKWNGRSVHAKADHMSPSGSFKDRGACVLVNYLMNQGIEAVVDDSSGNMGSALAMYAAAAGIKCRIVCPESTSAEKKAQIRAFGADLLATPGVRENATSVAMSSPEPWFYATHSMQPFFLEGTKTVAYEIWEQLGFRAPDAVIAPLGQGGNVLGCAIGFEELRTAGEIDRLPRIYGVQASNCAPLVDAAFNPKNIKPGIASGIQCAEPKRGDRIKTRVAGSGGALLAVSDDEITVALRSFLLQGLYVEPTTAVVGAAATRLFEENAIQPHETVVILLTGHGLKTAATINSVLHLTENPK
jgi:threonine synthase